MNKRESERERERERERKLKKKFLAIYLLFTHKVLVTRVTECYNRSSFQFET